jgi:hypothetical protein
MSPPPRPAHLFNEDDGVGREAAQIGLLMRLKGFSGIKFLGDAVGEVSEAVESAPNLFRASVESNMGAALVELSLAPEGWVKAELIVAGRAVFRAWIEDPYEEKSGWPDGADGVGEAPLRISKRGSWLSIETGRFPGVPGDQHGLFQLEEADR